MSEDSMDKKKKNEDEKEIIDFMEIVEENLSTLGAEKTEINKSDCCEDPIKSDLFENRPLQDAEETTLQTSSANINEGEKIEPEKVSDKKINEEKIELGKVSDEKIIEEIIESEKVSDKKINEEKIESEKVSDKKIIEEKIESGKVSDEEFMEGRSSSEVGDVITEDILEDIKQDLINGDSLEDDSYKDSLHEGLKNLNKHIKQMAVESITEKPLSNIILRKDDTLTIKNPFYKEDIRIHKYPGLLYINIYAIEKYISSDINVKSVFIRMETDNFVYETDDYSESFNIKLNSLVNLTLSNSKSFNLRFIMNKRTNKETKKSCECVININKEFLDKIHNTLYERSHEWTAYSSGNFVKSFFSFFKYSVADAYSLKLYFSFISEEEFKVIGVPVPNSLYDLGKWLKIRKHAYNTWFSGFCNIRGNITNICTHLWKRRFIKIYGYKVYIFNEHTKNLMGIFNLISTMTKDRQIFEEDNKIKIVNDGSNIEFHFESFEKYNMFRNVLEALL